MKNSDKIYYDNNKEKISLKKKDYRHKYTQNTELKRIWYNNKRNTDILYKLRLNIFFKYYTWFD